MEILAPLMQILLLLCDTLNADSMVLDAYRTGRGRVVVRGKTKVEMLDAKTKGNAVIITEISKLGVGQVYAASVMYWYFLKRIDQRFQLEKAMKILPGGSDEGETGIEQAGRKGEKRFYEET